MAFRNFVSKSSGKEASFMIKNPPLTPRDVGSPSRSEQGEASSKVVVKAEKVAEENKEVVDVDLYQEVEGEKVSIAKRVSNRKNVIESSSKRKAPPAKTPAAKKGKTVPGGKTSKENLEESEGSGDNLRPKSHYAIIAGTPEPSHCHRVIAACAPKGWIKGLDRMPMSELADLQSQSSLQLAIIDNVLNTKAREAAGELAHSQEEVEALNSKLMTQEEEIKATKLRLRELEKNIEASEKVTKMKAEVQELRESLHAQAMEMAELRIIETKYKTLGEEVEGLRTHVSKVEQTKEEVVTKVIPHVCKSLMNSEEAGVLLADCINSARVWERAIVLEELAASGETVVLSKREDYNAEAAHLFDSASEALANAQFPYVQEVSANPDASVEELLSISPKKVPAL